MESNITKFDLRIGNMFEQGIVWKISGRSGAKVHLHGKGKWYKGFRSEVDVEKLTPILLTSQVLMEWCGFDYFQKDEDIYFSKNGTAFIYGGLDGCKLFIKISSGEISNPKTGTIYIPTITTLEYLHELQNWWYFNKGKQELEIKG